MEELDDEFEDAHMVQTNDEMSLENALLDCKSAIDLFFNNKFDEARAILLPWVGKSMYHTMGYSVCLYIEAFLTFDNDVILHATDALKSCVKLCNSYRRKYAFLRDTIGKINPRERKMYSSMEAHAELCYAEALLLETILSTLGDESLFALIKAGIKVKTCYNSYKECRGIIGTQQWTDGSHKLHFESGVHVGIGTFNLMISSLPSRVIKLLEFIGFSGSKELGLSELDKAYRLDGGIRQSLAIMILLTYNLITLYLLSHGEGNLVLCEEILAQQFESYPDAAWYLFYKGRLEFMKGNVTDAKDFYIKSWQSQDTWIQFHHLCYWELMWVEWVLFNWEEAALYTSKLLEESKWSKCMFGYFKVANLLMKKALSPKEEEEIGDLVQKIPQWRQHIAGKSLPMEKFCSKRCERYVSQRFLILPSIELIYLWGLFKVLGKNMDLCQAFYREVLLSQEDCKNASSEFFNDNKALILLLKGACLYQLKNSNESEECFKEVVNMNRMIKEDTFLVPFALVELAIIYHENGMNEKALETLEDAKKNYTGYSLESRLHFKIHYATLDYQDSSRQSQNSNKTLK